ncbi:MAG TPA: hypothetical protein ENI76_07850 [Ignavibacteria bacterium]|nr:hypothetical protein [Ignavibacteria bacterium]
MGYAKISERLFDTDTARYHLDKIKKSIINVKIQSYKMVVDDDAVVRTTWTTTDDDLFHNAYDPKQFNIHFRTSTIEEISNEVLDVHFGKDVKTCNTRLSVYTTGKNASKYVDTLCEYFMNKIRDVLSDEILLAEKRINLEIYRITTSKEYEERKSKALADEVTSRILDLFRKFKCVPDDILSKAIREAKIDGIMEW